MALSPIDAIGTEVTSIYREYLAGSEGFSSNHQRCIVTSGPVSTKITP
jgi:hypothetical protein